MSMMIVVLVMKAVTVIVMATLLGLVLRQVGVRVLLVLFLLFSSY